MSSIFDLKTSTTELSSANAGTSRMLYEQHPPTRDVTGTNFSNGAIHNRFTVSGQKWWIPARSYLKMRCSLSTAAGAQLPKSSDIGPNMGLMGNLFQSGEFRIADKTVSRCSDFMASVDALDTRLGKSKSWLDSVGEASNMWESKVDVRINKIASDGLNSGSVSNGDSTRLQLGFDPLTSISYTQATKLLTFTLGTIPALGDVFQIGDIITFPATIAAGVAMTITNIVSATSMAVAVDEPGGDVGTAVLDFTVSRPGSEASRRVQYFELVWQPPMSIFKIGHALPSGKYELVLNPQTASVLAKRAIESLGADKVSGTDFAFNVVDFYFYTATVDGPRADDITYLIDLEETRCQVDTVSNATTLQQRNFDVSPSSYALTLAFQDNAAGTNSLYSASKFKVRTDQELNLTRMYLNYAGQNKPQPDANPNFVSTGTDYTTHRYMDSLLHSGSYFDAGGSESIEEYHERGAYYYFSWPRDGSDRSTRVNCNFQFQTSITDARVLLFDHYKSVARVQVQDGRVVDVQIDDA